MGVAINPHKPWDFTHDPHKRPIGCNGKYGSSGYVAHHRKGEPICLKCRASRNHYLREVRRKQPNPRILKPCGTPAAFLRHKRHGERVDYKCWLAERLYRSELLRQKTIDTSIRVSVDSSVRSNK